MCDHPGCKVEIDRGLSYVCGNMHGEDEVSCEEYFCEDHRKNYVECNGEESKICDTCKEVLLLSGDFKFDEEEGILCQK